MANRPVVKSLNTGLVRALISDDKFFTDFPEFYAIRSMKEQAKKKQGGCSRCRKNSQTARVLYAFAIILQNLAPDRLQKLKQRLGAQKLQYHLFNKQTSKYEIRSI